MSNKIASPAITAVLFVVAILIGSVLSTRVPSSSVAAAPSIGHAPLVLTPKAQLKTEEGRWSFAPDVPPPITRKEQRRVVVHWSVKETQLEVAPGVFYDDAWGFEGRIPGPLLRVREGDLVEIHLTNDANATHPHNIDFHFVSGPGGGASALNVGPGETAVLEARAMMPGFYMFHCATPDIPMHISNGMYGFVLVEPAEGLPPVDKEYFVVQSEIYRHDNKPGHEGLDMDRAEKGDAQYIVFNGSVGSMLKDKAPTLSVGQKVRIYVGNAGPNLISSFHVIGQIFDKVYREGDLITAPAQGVQTTLIPAGGSAVVEFTPGVPGTFLLVDHAIWRLHKGTVGSLTVNGPQNAEVYEPMTDRNKGTMSVDSHLGGGAMNEHSGMNMASHDMSKGGGNDMHMGMGMMGPGMNHMGMSNTPAPAPSKVAMPNGPVVKILPGSGVFKKGVVIKDFSPKVITVKAGTTVTWVNGDYVMTHNFIADHGEFKSPELAPNESYSVTFNQPGTFPYTCKPHPWMHGTVIVK